MFGLEWVLNPDSVLVVVRVPGNYRGVKLQRKEVVQVVVVVPEWKYTYIGAASYSGKSDVDGSQGKPAEAAEHSLAQYEDHGMFCGALDLVVGDAEERGNVVKSEMNGAFFRYGKLLSALWKRNQERGAGGVGMCGI